MACFLLLVLQAHGLSVADDTATSTLEEWYLVFEHDWLGELIENRTAPKKTHQKQFSRWKKTSKKTPKFVFWSSFLINLELQNCTAFPLAATKCWETEIVTPRSLWIGTTRFVDWRWLAGHRVQWGQPSFFYWGSKPCETATWQPNDLVLWAFGRAVSVHKGACNQLFQNFTHIYQLPWPIYKMVFQFSHKMYVPHTDTCSFNIGGWAKSLRIIISDVVGKPPTYGGIERKTYCRS